MELRWWVACCPLHCGLELCCDRVRVLWLHKKDVELQGKNILHVSGGAHCNCVLVFDPITFLHNNLWCVWCVVVVFTVFWRKAVNKNVERTFSMMCGHCSLDWCNYKWNVNEKAYHSNESEFLLWYFKSYSHSLPVAKVLAIFPIVCLI